MRIKNIVLNNFKFHKNLEFNIDKENSLIYGENGVGKSSIYWALYSIFKKDIIKIEEYRNYDSTDIPNVQITLNDTSYTQLGTNIHTNICNENSRSIYLAHQDFLEEITLLENFYEVIENSLKYFFPTLKEYSEEFNRINNNVDQDNFEEEGEKRYYNAQKFKLFLNQLELRVNDIIQNHFNENFMISMDINWGEIRLIGTDYELTNQRIFININKKKNLKLNFNEAKLKLASIAIFFGLIKLEEDKTNSLKLLILDDFLTSLDMANRKLIIQYILDNFGDYQKFILTHNIQFYNLIIKFLKMRNEDKKWDIKNIFLSENDTIALVNTKENNYLDDAKKQLLAGEYHSSGNYARKEFERIINEFKQILEIGKQEQLKHLIDTLKSIGNENSFFKKPFSVLNKLSDRYTNIETIIDNNDVDNVKINKIKTETNRIKSLLESEKCELSNLKNILNKVEFYKDILFNPASHSNDEIEVYRKECISSIRLLEELNQIVNSLK